jgi:predicted nucleic acid-binding protein
LEQAQAYQRVDVTIRERAEILEKHGLKAIDSLHIACAEAIGVEYFLTCDDRLLKNQKHLSVPAMNPLDFVQKVMGEQQ